jgi:hypothetical protein
MSIEIPKDEILNAADLESLPDFEVRQFEELKALQGEIVLSVYRREARTPHSYVFGGSLHEFGTLTDLLDRIQDQHGAGVYIIMLKTADGKLKRQYTVGVGAKGSPQSSSLPGQQAGGGGIELGILKPFLEEQARTLRELITRPPPSPAPVQSMDPIQMMAAMASMLTTMMTSFAQMSRANTSPAPQTVDPIEQLDRILMLADRLSERGLPPPEPAPGAWIGEVLDKVAPAFGQLLELEREKLSIARMGAAVQAAPAGQAPASIPATPPVPGLDPETVRELSSLSTASADSIMKMFRLARIRYAKEISQFIQLAKLKTDPAQVAAAIDAAIGQLDIDDDDALTLLKRPDAVTLLIGEITELAPYHDWVEGVRAALVDLIESSVSEGENEQSDA